MSNPLIIFGSSRNKGHTWDAIQLVLQHSDRSYPIINLNDLSISAFDYEHRNQSDDFLPLAEKMVNHFPLILATPVYWYTMSATMKIFVDRITDLLKIRKDLGKQLIGNKIFVIASFGTSMPPGFEDAFSQTCEYMNMEYGGCFYYYSGNDDVLKIKNLPDAKYFAKLISKTSKSAPFCCS